MPKKPLVMRSAAFVLSFVLLADHVFAYKPQVNVWGERRVAVQFSLPSLRHPRESGDPDSEPDKKNSTLENILPYGSIRKILNPQSSSLKSQTIIHIQDVHGNPEAQANISRALQALLRSGQVGAVALEGAFDRIDLTPFQEFPHPLTVKKVADRMLAENKIAGPIHAGLSVPSKFIGVDDVSHYMANVQAYRDATPRVKSTKEKLSQQEGELNKQKQNIFNEQLLKFDRCVADYRAGKLSLGAYLKKMSSWSPAATRRGEGGRAFLNALNLEATLNFTRVEVERSHLLSLLLSKLDKAQSDELVNASRAYRAGALNHTDFYSRLHMLCEKTGVSLTRFSALNGYIRYVQLADQIDAEKLFEETKALEQETYATLAKTDEERKLITELKRLYLTGKLVGFSLTKDEWEEYKSVSNLELEARNLGFFENFYRQAEIRDGKMAANLLRETRDYRLQPLNSKLIILVTGGFHSSGIDRRLADAGHTVISFVPKITKVETENGSAYLSVFNQEKTPLEKLFEGQKLFLADEAFSKDKERRIALGVTHDAALSGAIATGVLATWLSGILHTRDLHIEVLANSVVSVAGSFLTIHAKRQAFQLLLNPDGVMAVVPAKTALMSGMLFAYAPAISIGAFTLIVVLILALWLWNNPSESNTAKNPRYLLSDELSHIRPIPMSDNPYKIAEDIHASALAEGIPRLPFEIEFTAQELVDNAIDAITSRSSGAITPVQALSYVQMYTGYRSVAQKRHFVFAVENDGEIDLKEFKEKLPVALENIRSKEKHLKEVLGSHPSQDELNELAELSQSALIVLSLIGKESLDLADFLRLVRLPGFTTKAPADGMLGGAGMGISQWMLGSWQLGVRSFDGRTVFFVEVPVDSPPDSTSASAVATAKSDRAFVEIENNLRSTSLDLALRELHEKPTLLLLIDDATAAKLTKPVLEKMIGANQRVYVIAQSRNALAKISARTEGDRPMWSYVGTVVPELFKVIPKKPTKIKLNVLIREMSTVRMMDRRRAFNQLIIIRPAGSRFYGTTEERALLSDAVGLSSSDWDDVINTVSMIGKGT